MMTPSSQCSASRALPIVLLVFASACAPDDPDAQTTMTAQEIATAGNIPTCNAVTGGVHCHSRVICDATGHPRSNLTPAGYGPSQLRSAYKLPATGNSASIVAIVDAFGYPNAEADLAVYRRQFGLPPCTTANGCFRKVNQTGATSPLPAANLGWEEETALDLDMVSAICPSCKLLLVEANSPLFDDISTAVGTAADLGAHVINNSYGGDEFAGTPYDTDYFYPGMVVVASTGDSGYGTGLEFPSSSPNVVAVGGTTLTTATNTRGWTETAWTGSNSGCSATMPKPSWQHDTGCTHRMIADIAAVADPNTGVAVYGPSSDTTASWIVLGGTSVAAPIISGVAGAYSGPGSIYTGPIGLGASDLYVHTGLLFDVRSGSTGFCDPTYFCNAGAGYDGPTGLGTPNGAGTP